MGKKKKKSKQWPSFLVEVPLFDHLTVGVFFSFKRHRAFAVSIGVDPDDEGLYRRGCYATAYRLPGPKGMRYHTLVFGDKKVPVGRVFHECLHAALYIFDSFGVRISGDSEEVLAYLQGHLAEQVITGLKKANRYAG